jgi:hypothetical protein
MRTDNYFNTSPFLYLHPAPRYFCPSFYFIFLMLVRPLPLPRPLSPFPKSGHGRERAGGVVRRRRHLPPARLRLHSEKRQRPRANRVRRHTAARLVPPLASAAASLAAALLWRSVGKRRGNSALAAARHSRVAKRRAAGRKRSVRADRR